MKHIPIFGKLVLALLLLYLINISQLDSLMWIDNGQLFLNALKTGDLSKTYIGPDLFHPGITIVWITALVNQLFGWIPMQYLIIIHRATFVGLFAILLLFSYRLWIKYFSSKLFFLTLVYILFNPFSLLWGTITWLDSLLLFLTLPVVLSWIQFLKTKQQIYLITSGIFIGLSVLTKYIGADRYLMIVGITIFYTLKYQLSFSKYITALLKTGLIAFLTFTFLYPAFWIDPIFVLFNRYDTKDSFQTLSYTHIASTWEIYLKYFRKVDLLIWGGLGITLFLWTKKQITNLHLLGISGMIHFLILVSALVFLIDLRRGNEAFLASIGRYQIGSIILLAPIYFRSVLKQKNQLLKYGLILIPFTVELYFVYRFSYYPWLT